MKLIGHVTKCFKTSIVLLIDNQTRDLPRDNDNGRATITISSDEKNTEPKKIKNQLEHKSISGQFTRMRQ